MTTITCDEHEGLYVTDCLRCDLKARDETIENGRAYIKHLQQENKRLRVQFRCNRLPGGPGNEAEFIELETWGGKGLGPANGWGWVRDGDSYVLTADPEALAGHD